MQLQHSFIVQFLSFFVPILESVNSADDKTYLIAARAKLVLEHLETHRDVNWEKGWFLAKAHFADGDMYVDKKYADSIASQIKQNINSYHRKRYAELFKESQTIAGAIASFFDGMSFKRRSKFEALLNSLVKPDLIPITYGDLISPEKRTVINAIRNFFETPYLELRSRNQAFIKYETDKYAGTFNELNPSQKASCVINDDTNLVLAGAGTGKTKTMVSRAQYLLESGLYTSKEILMVAYGREARKEMEERVEKNLDDKLSIYTFHGLGKRIIESGVGTKVHVHEFANDEKMLINFINSSFIETLNTNTVYQAKALTYFDNYLFPYRNPFDFKTLGDYYHYIKTNEIRAFSTDKVKSYEEVIIANFLYKNQIKFEYEPSYKGSISFVGFSRYKPDFYLNEFDIYIEHFGVNEKMRAPAYMNPTKYAADMEKKRQIHKSNNTTLIETYSFQQSRGVLLKELERKLIDLGVNFNPLSQEQYLDKLRGFGAVSKLGKLLAGVMKSSRTMGYDLEELKQRSSNGVDADTALALIGLLEPIYKKYLEKLGDEIDYDFMISDAIRLIETGQVKLPFKTIMIDEYQDISPPRASLIKAILGQDPEITLFSVGDDWQGIYRFSGADLNLTYEFEKFFRAGTTVSLDQTYRFNNSISSVTTEFVTKNPKQLKKKINARTVDSRRVHIVKATAKEQQEQIMKTISWLSSNANRGNILLLNRYRYKMPNYLQLIQYAKQLGFKLRFDSVHSSKGKEADHVILMDMESGKNGFPAEKIDHPLVDMILPKREQFDFAEERRLFYVALTRAKEHVFIVSIAENTSSFVRELMSYEEVSTKTINDSPLSTNVFNEPCPVCETGELVKRSGPYGSFVACTNYPLCEHKSKTCTKCDSPRRAEQDFYVCLNKRCGWKDVRCDACGSEMVKRDGPYGYFYGCTSYPSCKNTKDTSEVSF